MKIPTTPLKLPIQGKPLDEDGNWTPTWARTLQLLFNRVGAYTAPSNLQLAGVIGSFVAGPASSVDGDVVVFSGTTGKLVTDGSIKIAGLAPIASPAFTGIPTAPTPTAGTSTAQLATTSFVATATSGSGNVFGPASSISSNIVLFNGLTGRVIADSGVQLSALAPLASPAFTGTATAVNVTFSGLALTAASATGNAGIRLPHGTAPTAPVNGDFWSTTLGFFGCVSGATVGPFGAASAGAASSFSAHNNGAAQAIPHNAQTVLTFSTTAYNVGANYSANVWTPPSGRPVSLVGSVCYTSTAGGYMAIAIYKNGVSYKQGVAITTVAGTTQLEVVCMDVPSGTDVYDLRVYQLTGVAQNTIGASANTYFQGTTITP